MKWPRVLKYAPVNRQTRLRGKGISRGFQGDCNGMQAHGLPSADVI
jgi:hypothetical protein